MERLFVSMQNAREAGLLIRKGYESRIISLEDIVFCEIIDRKVYLNLVSSEVVDYYDRIVNLENKLVRMSDRLTENRLPGQSQRRLWEAVSCRAG